MFDQILANLDSIQDGMVQMYRDQYEWGWFGDDKATSNAVLRSYVRTDALTKEGYKEITGKDYDQAIASQPQA